ncbi:MAG: CAP domain-containing protein [Myxococcota bacterium]|nr:CAP domain-containing protein [Myxococcota bacterium]
MMDLLEEGIMGGRTYVAAWLVPVCILMLLGCDDQGGQALNAPEPAVDLDEESLLVGNTNDSTPLWEVDSPDQDLPPEEALVALLNVTRAELKLGPVVVDEKLRDAATSHAEFLAIHKSHYDTNGVSLHEQPKGLEGFTGESYTARAAFFGYEGKTAEVVANKPTAVGALRSWMETVYHRIPLLDPKAIHVGYGEAEADGLMVNVLEVGFRE